MKRIGIDIDGTVTCPTTFIPYLNKSFQKNLTLNDITEYNLSPILGIPEKQVSKWFDENEEAIYINSPLATNAQSVISKLDQKFELYYISARKPNYHDLTLEWFKTNDIPYDYIELVGETKKSEAVLSHHIQLFIEDHYDNACIVGEECSIPVLLFDTPYNRKPLPNNVFRINSWDEAYKWIQSQS